MPKGIQITFSVNPQSYGIGIENENYTAYIGVKHQRNNTDKEPQRKKLKPYRRPNKGQN